MKVYTHDKLGFVDIDTGVKVRITPIKVDAKPESKASIEVQSGEDKALAVVYQGTRAGADAEMAKLIAAVPGGVYNATGK